MRKLIAVLAALAALAVAAPAQATNSTNVGWHRVGTVVNNGSTITFQTGCYAAAHLVSQDNTHLQAGSWLACGPGPGGQNWQTWGTPIFSGVLYELFTIKDVYGNTAGVAGGSLCPPSTVTGGAPTTCRLAVWTSTLPQDDQPYWWNRANMALTVPTGYHWLEVGNECAANSTDRTLSCSLNNNQIFVTHHE